MNKLSKIFIVTYLLLNFSAFANEQKERFPAGARALSVQEHVAIQEMRLENAGKESDSQDPVEDKEVHFEIDQERTNDENGEFRKELLQVYHTSHDAVFYNPLFISINGDIVELHDGSIWTVSFWDRYKLMKWLNVDTVVITQNPSLFSSYYYQLINLQTGDKVAVNLKTKPFYNGFYTRWIVGMDFLLNQIILNDGSIWAVDSWDSSIIHKWLFNDTIILGINEHNCGNGCSQNILINAETTGYVRAMCIFK